MSSGRPSVIRRARRVRDPGAARATPFDYDRIGDSHDSSPYVDDTTGEFAVDDGTLPPARSSIGMVGTVAGIIGLLLLSLAVGYGVWIHTIQQDVGVLQKVIIVNPNIPFLDVYIDPLNGNDVTGTGRIDKPYITLDRALLRISKCTGTRATIHIVGATCGAAGALDLGTDPMYDFFPATSQYAELVIRGARASEITTTVQGINVLPGANEYVQVVTTMGGLVPDAYQNNFVHNVADNRIFVVEDNTINALDIVGGNVQDLSVASGVSNPIAFTIGDTINAYTICNALTWEGTLRLNHSYHRVCIEDLELIPSDNQSIWVNPPLRDDAVVFRGVRMNVLGTASVVSDDDTGLPEFTDLAPTYRGSMYLEGVHIDGTGIVDAAFNSLRDNVCARMNSVRVTGASVFFADTCSAFFVSFDNVESSDTLTISNGEFRGHGLKFRAAGPTLHLIPRAIHISGASSVYLTHIDIEGVIARAIDADGASYGIISKLRADLTANPESAPLGPVLHFDEAGTYNVYELDVTGGTCIRASGTSHIHMNQEFVCVPIATHAIQVYNGATINFNVIIQNNGVAGPTPWSVINQLNAYPIVHVDSGSTFHLMRSGAELEWTTLDNHPLVQLNRKSRFIGLETPLVSNENPNNADYILRVGVNAPTAYTTQDDYLAPNSERCDAVAADPLVNQQVWVNGVSGDDAGPGSQAIPVETLDAAIRILGQRRGSTLECTIWIIGTLNLGTTPTICTQPLEKICKRIVIRGRDTTPVSDTVQSIASIAPDARNWQQITGVTGGYGINTYQTHFVRKTTLMDQRVYTVDSNAAATVDTVIGPSDAGASPWTMGDTYTLFTVADTLTWMGALSLDIPYNSIVFDALIMAPSMAGSRIVAPIVPRVTFQGCHINAMSDSVATPSLSGSVNLRGCYSNGLVPNAVFTGEGHTQMLDAQSLWIDASELNVYGTAHAWGLKSSHSVNVVGGALHASHIHMDESTATVGISVQKSTSRAQLTYITSSRTVAATDHIAIRADASARLGISHINIVCTTGQCIGIYADHQSTIHIQDGITNVEAILPLVIARHASIDIVDTDVVLSGNLGTAVSVGSTATCVISPNTITVDMLAIPSPVFGIQNNAKLVLEGSAGDYALTTVAGTPLVHASDGAHVVQTLTGGTLTNGGTNSEHVLVCGTHPIDPWTTSDHDDTTNVQCTRTGVPQPDPEAVRTIYVDASGAGDDGNRGTVTTEAVETIGRAIEIMALRNAIECVVQLQGGVAFDLGADPTLCFDPVQRTCKHVRIVGSETIVGTGTIDVAPAVIDGTGRNWRRIEDTGASFTPSAFIKQFIRNDATPLERIYVIEDNAGTTIDTIAGDSAWTMGDTFTVLSLTDSITWTGHLFVDIPYNSIVFERIHIAPGADGSTLRAKGARTVFKGCQLDARSFTESLPSYRGTLEFRGVYVEGVVADAYATSAHLELDALAQCLITESVWFDQAHVYYSDCQSSATFTKSTASPGAGLVVSRTEVFRGLGTYITESAGDGFVIQDSSMAYVNDIHVVCENGTALLAIDGGRVQLGSGMTLNGPAPIVVGAEASLHVIGDPILSGFDGVSGSPLTAMPGSSLTLQDATAFTVDMDTAIAPGSVVACDGCQFQMLGDATGYIWGTVAPYPLVDVTNGGVARGRYTGNLANTGPNVTDVIMCGGNPISDWIVAENDYTLAPGTTQGCNCAR